MTKVIVAKDVEVRAVEVLAALRAGATLVIVIPWEDNIAERMS